MSNTSKIVAALRTARDDYMQHARIQRDLGRTKAASNRVELARICNRDALRAKRGA